MVKPPPRVVLDTNVVLSALVFRSGQAARLRALWQQEALLPIVNRETAAELLRVLAYPKFKLGASEREELLADYLPYAEVWAGADASAPDAPVCRDPADQMFIDLAHSANAQNPGCASRDGLVQRCLSLRAQCTGFAIAGIADFLKLFPA